MTATHTTGELAKKAGIHWVPRPLLISLLHLGNSEIIYTCNDFAIIYNCPGLTT